MVGLPSFHVFVELVCSIAEPERDYIG